MHSLILYRFILLLGVSFYFFSQSPSTLYAVPSITIDAQTVTQTINSGLGSSNLEPGLPLWPHTKTQLFQSLSVPHLQTAGITYMRFPLGCIVDIYPFPRDPNNLQIPGYDGTYGRFNLQDWLLYLSRTNTKPIITINIQGSHPYQSCVNGTYFEGTVEDAAHLVEFFNSPNDGNHPWAAARARLGFPNPVGVTYFQLGNEPYSDNRPDRINFPTIEARIANYAQTVVVYSQSMKQVDPAIKIAAATFAHRNNPMVNGVRGPFELEPVFFRDQLYAISGFASAIDVISTHNEQRGGCSDETPYVHALTRINERSDTLQSLYPGKEVYFDETTLCTEPAKTNVASMIGNAAGIISLAKQNVQLSAYFHIPGFITQSGAVPNNAGFIYTYDLSTYFKTPVYYVYSDIFKELWNSRAVSIVLNNPDVFNYVRTSSCPVTDGCPISTNNVPRQTAIAYKNSINDSLYLVVINLLPNSSSIPIAINNFSVSSSVEVTTLSGPNLTSENTITSPLNIVPSYQTIPFSNPFTFTFSPYSVTKLTFHSSLVVTQTPSPTTTLIPTVNPSCICSNLACAPQCEYVHTSSFYCKSDTHCTRPFRYLGDSNGDDKIDLIDLINLNRQIWLDTTIPSSVIADFNGDGEWGSMDLNIWRNNNCYLTPYPGGC